MATGVISIRLGMVNAFLVRGDQGAILVDTGYPGNVNRILEALTTNSVAPEGLRLILITHGHIDHFGSAAALRERTGAPVAVHALDAPALRQGRHPAEWLQPTNRVIALLLHLAVRLGPEQVPGLEPDILFSAPWRLDDYGVAGRVIPLPGHTPGSAAVLLDDGAAIVGDIRMDLTGLRRRPGKPVLAWDLAQNEASVRQLAALKPHPIYAGHGGPFPGLE